MGGAPPQPASVNRDVALGVRQGGGWRSREGHGGESAGLLKRLTSRRKFGVLVTPRAKTPRHGVARRGPGRGPLRDARNRHQHLSAEAGMGRALWARPRGVTTVSMGAEERGPLTCRVTWRKAPLSSAPVLGGQDSGASARVPRRGAHRAQCRRAAWFLAAPSSVGPAAHQKTAGERKGPDPERHGSFVAKPSAENAKVEVHCQKKCALEKRWRPTPVRQPHKLGALSRADAPRGPRV